MNEKLLKNSKIEKYFDKDILNNKKKRDLLISFEEILKIKKNIKQMFDTDNPDKIKNLVGKKKNNLIVKEKDYKYSVLIEKTYKNLYERCKKELSY